MLYERNINGTSLVEGGGKESKTAVPDGVPSDCHSSNLVARSDAGKMNVFERFMASIISNSPPEVVVWITFFNRNVPAVVPSVPQISPILLPSVALKKAWLLKS